MENWKRALLAAPSVASVILLLRGKRAPGILFGGISLATLASEYPDQFAEFRENLPDYVERGTRFLDVVTRAGERLAEAAETRSSAWYEALLRG